jgi:hypothetical protein
VSDFKHYLVEWIYTVDFPGRPVPVVYLADGAPGFSINQWIYWLIQEGMTPSLLEKRVQHVMHLYEFHFRKYAGTLPDKGQSQHLVKDFLEAKKNGSELMGWDRITNKATLSGYLKSIDLFDEWQSTWHGSDRLNPSEKRFMSSWEIYAEWQHRKNWDAMLHLFPSKSTEKKTHQVTVGRFDHRRWEFGGKKIPKAFPFEKFPELVERTPNPRDQMAWLLMGGGSLRQSEPLHLFYEDVRGLDSNGGTRIRLDDPDEGAWAWEIDGSTCVGTRSQYFDACFENERFKFTRPELNRLKPRTKGKKGKDHSGWKGMTFSETPDAEISSDGRLVHPHEVWWCDPRMGSRFQHAYQEYVEKYFNDKPSMWPYHPWLFICTDHENFGLPWTLKSLNRAWRRALKRVGLENSGLGPHSLRHMYGAYCASVLKLPIEIVMGLMHHRYITSTQKYYHIRSKTVQRAISQAIEANPRERILDHVILPDSKPVSLALWGEV